MATPVAVSVAWVHVFPHVAPAGKVDAAGPRTTNETTRRANRARAEARGEHRRAVDPLATGSACARACAPSIHHPQGYGLGNAGQTASRTGTPIKAGESNYTELGAETGLLGALLWIAWGLAIFAALVLHGAATTWWAAAGIAAAFAAALVLAVQTDVIGDPWMAYCLWALAGIALAPVPLTADGDRLRASTSATST